MEKEIFKDAKVGDRVWDMRFGWGTIHFTGNSSSYPIHVVFDMKYQDKQITGTYTFLGKVSKYYTLPSLFWNEFEIPKEAFIKPLPKLEIDTKVLVWNVRTIKMKRHFSHFNKEGKIYCFDEGRTSFTQEGGIERISSTSGWDNYEIYQEGDN